MPDIGHLETEELINQAERRLRVVYNEAVQDVSNKLDAYLKDFARKDEQWKKMLADGKISQQDYNDWRVGQIMMGKRWDEMKQTLAQDLHNSNVIARSVVNGYRPDAYAINHNYATFLVEKGSQMDTSYTLYDKQTVERLMLENPQLLPPPGKRIMDRVNAGKDILWQEDHIQSVTLQAILQGESIGSMADRIARTMGEFDHRDSVRYARTAMTGAQNAGRHDGYVRANKMGIPMKQTWIATLDNRTRDTHRILDGQTVEIDEPFEVDGMEIRYPGDPDAPGELIWNCRCTTIAQIQGFERDASNMELRYDERLGTMSYEDWKYEHREKPEAETKEFSNDKLKGILGNDYDAFAKLVSGNETQPLYDKYIDECREIRRVSGGGVYQYAFDSLQFDYESHPGMSRYSTLAHESGHMFDAKIGKMEGLHYTEADTINSALDIYHIGRGPIRDAPSQSDEFLTALRKDMDALRSSVNDRSIRTVFLATEETRNATSGIQDALDGFFGTQDSRILPWGHGDRYYNKEYNLRIDSPERRNALKDAYNQLGFGFRNQTQCKEQFRQYRAAREAWANTCSAITCGGQELEAISQYMPNTLETVRKIIGGIG